MMDVLTILSLLFGGAFLLLVVGWILVYWAVTTYFTVKMRHEVQKLTEDGYGKQAEQGTSREAEGPV